MNKKVKIINRSRLDLKYATKGSSGMDIRADLRDKIILNPGKRVLIPTGLFLKIPKGVEGQIRPRSGLAIKHGITVLNSPGTIDSDYIGEIKIILINHGEKDFIINYNDRIAQIVFSKIIKIKLLDVAVLKKTKRGINGFGHTGTK